MTGRTWAVLLVVLSGAVFLTPGPDAAGQAETKKRSEKKAAKETPGAGIFGLAKVHEMTLQLTAKEWEKMQPAGGGRFPGGPGGFPGRPGGREKAAEKPVEKATDVHKGAGFGMEFPWAHGAFTAQGKTFDNVGVRYKGNFSYMASSRGLKRNLKIAFDHYEEEQRCQGLKKINLNAGAADPTRMRESLSFAVFRAAGVPAPRTAFAEVSLTVPGKYDKELLGLYTIVEQVDKVFLKDRFKNSKGLLMKPERLRGLEYLGDDWERYQTRYLPKHAPSKKQAKRVIDFARLINKGSDEAFRKEIGAFLDVDAFLRFVAVNALLVNLDSFLGVGHNYYIYLNPETNKFAFIPWDLDLSLGGFPGGTTEQKLNLSLTHPYMGNNKLIDRLFAVKDVRDKYGKVLEELAKTCFAKEPLLKDVDAIEKVMKAPLAREKKAVAARKEGGGFGFGPPGGAAGGRPGGPGPGAMLAPVIVKRADANKDDKVTLEELLADAETLFKAIDKDRKGKLDESGIAAAINLVFPPPPGGRPGRPGGFAMGALYARPLLLALDADKDGKVSRDELVAGVKKFFALCDNKKNATIDEKAVADGLTRILPAPRGFGPPGGGGSPFGQAIDPRTFVAKRTESVAAQLAGKSKGYVPAGMGFGPGGPGGPGGFGMGLGLAKPLLLALDADKDGKVSKDELAAGVKKFFTECDKDTKGKLSESQVAEGINRIFPPPPGFPGGPPGGGRGGFGPGAMFAGAIVKRADTDKDGKVTLKELLAAAEALFQEIDKDRDGKLDEKELAAAVGLLFPPPPGFGRPGGFRPPG